MALGERIQTVMERDRAGVAAGVIAFGILTALFLVLRFPYHQLEPWLERALEASTGAHVSLHAVEGELDGLTPKVRARGGSLTWPDGTTLRFRYARAMPALSLSWLWGQPLLALKVNSDWGNFRGFVRPRRAAVEGTIEEFSAESLPLADWGVPARLVAPAAINVRGERSDEAWVGSVAFRGGPGSLTLGESGVAIPFQTLTGRLRTTGEDLELEGPLEIDGPLAHAEITGRLAGTGPVAQRRLDLELVLELRDRSFANLMSGIGVPLAAGATGTQQLRIGGQLGRPVAVPVRSAERARR